MRIYIGGANDGNNYIWACVRGGVFDYCLSYYPPGRYDTAWKAAAKKMLAELARPEEEMTTYIGGDQTPGRIDALVSGGVRDFCVSYFYRKTWDQSMKKATTVYYSSGGGGNTHVIVPALREGGISALCVSYYYKNTWEKTKPEAKKEVRLFVDSGAFSFMNQLLVKRQKFDEAAMHTYLEGYVAWVKEIQHMVDGCVTFDYLPEAPLTRKMTELLRKRYKLDTIPVYHGDAGLDVIRRYAGEGVKKLCLSKRNFLKDRAKLPHYYDQCFNLAEKLGLRYHGLACTGPEMFRYPWDSVDSTSLIRTSFLGGLYVWAPGQPKLRTVQISEKADGATDIHGVTAEQLAVLRTDYRARITYNAQVFAAFCASREKPKTVRRLI